MKESPRRLVFRIVMTALFITGVIVLPFFISFGDRRFNLPEFFAYPLNLSGVFSALLGFMLVNWGAQVFRTEGRGTPYLGKPPQTLVTSGAYRFVRNPIFLGLFLILVGFGILVNSTALISYSFAMLFGFHN